MKTTSPQKPKPGRPPVGLLKDLYPELAAQVVDQSLLATLSKGSNSSILWRCNDFPDHIWEARVYNRTNAKNKTGCPICNGKMILPGFNDVATTHPEAAKFLADQSLITKYAAKSNASLKMRCQTDPSHLWTAPLARISTGTGGCPYCSGRRAIPGKTDLATTHPKLALELADQSLATTLKAGTPTNVDWVCTRDSSHIYPASPYTRTKTLAGCTYCSGRRVIVGQTDIATTHPQIAATLQDPSLGQKYSQGSDANVTWTCPVHPLHIWNTTIHNRINKSSCPFCSNRKIISGSNDLATTHPDLTEKLVDPNNATVVSFGTSQKLTWKCEFDPEHTWESPPGRLLGPKPAGCTQCYKEKRSAPENELFAILTKLLPPSSQIITSDRTTLSNNTELDIIIPDKKIAIEFNGMYWHSEAILKSKNYHAEKSKLAKQAGYQLIHIWEDNWTDNKDIVIRSLAHRLQASHNLLKVLPDIDPMFAEKIYARKLTLSSAQGKEARAFWQENHIQGPVGSKYYFALKDDKNQIRALLGVGTTNHGSRKKPVIGQWDIQRYATCGVIPGGFTRLLKYATSELKRKGETVTHWTSFSNNDVSNGGMYLAAGFNLDKTQAPSYSYVGTPTKWQRSHRSNFTRQRFETDPNLLYEENWTEHEAALANNLLRIYDAGKTRWIKEVA